MPRVEKYIRLTTDVHFPAMYLKGTRPIHLYEGSIHLVYQNESTETCYILKTVNGVEEELWLWPSEYEDLPPLEALAYIAD